MQVFPLTCPIHLGACPQQRCFPVLFELFMFCQKDKCHMLWNLLFKMYLFVQNQYFNNLLKALHFRFISIRTDSFCLKRQTFWYLEWIYLPEIRFAVIFGSITPIVPFKTDGNTSSGCDRCLVFGIRGMKAMSFSRQASRTSSEKWQLMLSPIITFFPSKSFIFGIKQSLKAKHCSSTNLFSNGSRSNLKLKFKKS